MVYWSFWGMHVFWWLFWALMVVLFFTAIAPASRSRARFEDDDPNTILRRRYARGELSTAEYEERLVVLRRTYPETAPLEREAERRSREPTPPPGATPVPSAT